MEEVYTFRKGFFNRNNKKGQLELGNAPKVVIIIGLTFLIMATLALIGQKYGAALPTSSGSVSNETLGTVDGSYVCVSKNSLCNFQDFTVSAITNTTAALDGVLLVPVTNYTTSNTGCVKSSGPGIYNATSWNISYTYSYSNIACNVTADMQTEIGNNTSIAGIVLTISLVGMVLTILMGIFLGLKETKGNRV